MREFIDSNIRELKCIKNTLKYSNIEQTQPFSENKIFLVCETYLV